jgi:hypothetical protein
MRIQRHAATPESVGREPADTVVPPPSPPLARVGFFRHDVDPEVLLPLPPGEGGDEGPAAMPPTFPHPNPLPEGEGTKNLLREASSPGESRQRGGVSQHPTPEGRPSQRPVEITPVASHAETFLIQRTPAPPPLPPMPPTRAASTQPRPSPAPARLPQAVVHRAVEAVGRVGTPPQEMPLAPRAIREVAPRGEEPLIFIQRYPAHGSHPDQSRLTQDLPAATAWLQAQPDTIVTPGALGPWEGDAETQPEETPQMEEFVEKGLRQLLRRLALEGERRGWQPWL